MLTSKIRQPYVRTHWHIQNHTFPPNPNLCECVRSSLYNNIFAFHRRRRRAASASLLLLNCRSWMEPGGRASGRNQPLGIHMRAQTEWARLAGLAGWLAAKRWRRKRRRRDDADADAVGCRRRVAHPPSVCVGDLGSIRWCGVQFAWRLEVMAHHRSMPLLFSSSSGDTNMRAGSPAVNNRHTRRMQINHLDAQNLTAMRRPIK